MDVSATHARVTYICNYKVEGEVSVTLTVSDLKGDSSWVRFVHADHIVFVPVEQIVEIVVL